MPKLFHQGSPLYLDNVYSNKTKPHLLKKMTIHHLINKYIYMSFIYWRCITCCYYKKSLDEWTGRLFFSFLCQCTPLCQNRNNYAILEKFCSHIESPSLSTLSCIIYSFSITNFTSFRIAVWVLMKTSSHNFSWNSWKEHFVKIIQMINFQVLFLSVWSSLLLFCVQKDYIFKCNLNLKYIEKAQLWTHYAWTGCDYDIYLNYLF